MYKVGETVAGTILVEMMPEEWAAVNSLFKTSDNFIEHLGDELARYRRERGLSQSEVAKQLGVSRTYISLVERGIATNVSSRMRRRITELVMGEQKT
jgi:DNA-binding XRE family transcriptional regulator